RSLTKESPDVKMKVRWVVGGASIAALVAYCGWLVYTNAPAYQFLVRLYLDKIFLKQTLREWGVLAPVIFIGLQVWRPLAPAGAFAVACPRPIQREARGGRCAGVQSLPSPREPSPLLAASRPRTTAPGSET